MKIIILAIFAILIITRFLASKKTPCYFCDFSTFSDFSGPFLAFSLSLESCLQFVILAIFAIFVSDFLT